MEKLTLRNGKFYRGDEIVPLEFGNKEQIKLIEQADKRMSEFRSEDGGEVAVVVVSGDNSPQNFIRITNLK